MSDDAPEGFDDDSTVLHASIDPSPADATFVVSVIEGPDVGQSHELDALAPSALLVGQSPACGFLLGDRSVSRRHLALAIEDNRLRVTDLGSLNGTFIGEVAIVDAFVHTTGRIRLGQTLLEVHRTDKRPDARLPNVGAFEKLVGASTEMRRLYPLCEKLASSQVPVIIEGETGTGKEVLAESLHAHGPRARGPFAVFDCTAVPPSLMEAELFGHERGSFTGAVATRRGVFERAHRGTLLIDEIGDLETQLQPKLLRVLERGEVLRIGGDRPISVDVRVLAATRRDLDREVAAGRFRDDLFHRLAVTRIELPPLRKRKGDVSVLARHFMQELGQSPVALPSALLRRWEDHAWPGNVRELRNAVARFVALGDAELIDLLSSHQPGAPTPGADDFWASVLDRDLPLSEARKLVNEEFEQRYVARLLQRHQGNITRAAEAAGVAKRYFQLLKAKGTKNER